MPAGVVKEGGVYRVRRASVALCSSLVPPQPRALEVARVTTARRIASILCSIRSLSRAAARADCSRLPKRSPFVSFAMHAQANANSDAPTLSCRAWSDPWLQASYQSAGRTGARAAGCGWSGISLSRGEAMRRRATERAPSSRHAHPQNSMNDGLWPDACAVFNSRRLHPKLRNSLN